MKLDTLLTMVLVAVICIAGLGHVASAETELSGAARDVIDTMVLQCRWMEAAHRAVARRAKDRHEHTIDRASKTYWQETAQHKREMAELRKIHTDIQKAKDLVREAFKVFDKDHMTVMTPHSL